MIVRADLPAASDIVIVGGSVAATRAAEASIRHAPSLTVTVISEEDHLPYERPPLSKLAVDSPVDLGALTYPAVAKLIEQGVSFALGARATGLDLARQQVRTTASDIGYGSLVVATGCEPIIPPLFAERRDVYPLRTHADAVALRRSVEDRSRSVAIVGAGFIGGEFASTLVKHGREVALIDMAEHPLGRLGVPVAEAYEQLHRDHGVRLHLGNGVVDIAESGGAGRELVLADGTRVGADVIVLGVGVRPSTTWLDGSGLRLESGVVCSATLRAGYRVFAAGDLARWPNPRYEETMRVEHWTSAAEQGRTAGLNAARTVLGEPLETCSVVPYFWSDQHGVRIQHAGRVIGGEEIVESHSAAGSLYLYRDGDMLAGVVAFERRSQFVQLRARLRAGLSWTSATGLAEARVA